MRKFCECCGKTIEHDDFDLAVNYNCMHYVKQMCNSCFTLKRYPKTTGEKTIEISSQQVLKEIESYNAEFRKTTK